MTEETSRTARNYRFPVMARDAYRVAGWRIIEPGSVEGARYGLHGVDWHPDTFAAVRKKAVELPLLVARKPGTGAFPRLIERLREQGYRVTVAAPLGEFRAHLARAGWIIDTYGEHGEIWRRPD